MIFIFEYVNPLSEKRAHSWQSWRRICILQIYSTYGKFVETGLKGIKVKFVSSFEKGQGTISKCGYDSIASTKLYSENLIGIKRATPIRKVDKPFFIDFAILGNVKTYYLRFLLQRTEESIWQDRIIRSRYRLIDCTTKTTLSIKCVKCTNCLISPSSI